MEWTEHARLRVAERFPQFTVQDMEQAYTKSRQPNRPEYRAITATISKRNAVLMRAPFVARKYFRVAKHYKTRIVFCMAAPETVLTVWPLELLHGA